MENLKLVQLKSDSAWQYDNDFMWDEMIYEAERILTEEHKLEYDSIKGIKIYGDVSYCQGRCIAIDGLRLGNSEIEKMFDIKIDEQWDCVLYTKSGRGNWTDVSDECIKTDYEEEKNYVAIDTEGNKIKRENIVDWFENVIKDMERQLMKYGEELSECYEKESVCRDALDRRGDVNKIEGLENIRDYDYTTDKNEVKEGMIQIAEDGDTNLDGLWVEIDLEKKTREEIFYIVK